jgi:ribosomal protein L11 methyltransferase
MMNPTQFHVGESNSFLYRYSRMYLWQRLATQNWWIDNKKRLGAVTGNQLAVIARPNRKQLQLEVASQSRRHPQQLRRKFGGRIKKLPRGWLKQFTHRKTKPIKIGSARLIIPAGAAFGTGEHATTAMSLRLLEELSRRWPPGWSMADLGTGSGILPLAAKCLGATRAIGIDNDPIAISTAKQNARLNRIRRVKFQVADTRCWNLPRDARVVTANLFSELLIEISPKLKVARWLILSGFLRNQEHHVTGALRRNKIDIVKTRRRGKWVAVLAAVR